MVIFSTTVVTLFQQQERVSIERGLRPLRGSSLAPGRRADRRARPAGGVTAADEDGYLLIRRLRARVGRLPAVALTADARAEDRGRALSAGFQMHVAKPVEPAALTSAVAGLAGQTRSTS